MMNKIELIGIAVSNLEEAIKTYEQLLGTPCYKQEEVSSEGVKTAFFQVGESKIELLEATTETRPIAGFIAKKGRKKKAGCFSAPKIIQRCVGGIVSGKKRLNRFARFQMNGL